MHTPQTIVIIGAGNKAKAITSGLANARDRVLLCDTDYESAQAFTNGLRAEHPSYNIEPIACSYEATWEADIIILALASCPDLQEIAKKIKAVANQKIVVTTTDAAKELQDLLPNSKIVQAFANLDDESFNQACEYKKQINCVVQGCNEEALDTVSDLVKTIGFHPIILKTSEVADTRAA